MIDWAQILTVANLLILLAVTFGGYFALKSALARSEIDVQTRVRDALSAENNLLQKRVERLEKENKRLENLLQLVVTTLNNTHHIDLEIDGDMITMRSPSGGTHVSRINNAP